MQRKIEEVVLAEKARAEEDADSDQVAKQMENIKKLVKKEARYKAELDQTPRNRPEFPMRFAAKPFVHYGYTAKLAALKKREVNERVKENDNKMKMYIALLQKEKRSKKPTIQTIENQRRSPARILMEETQKSIDISEDINKINIETRPKLHNIDLDVSSTKNYSSQPIISTVVKKEEELPQIVQAEASTPQKLNMNDSILLQQSLLNEVTALNKSVIEKNNEHVPKQKIISSIRKFDDRCKRIVF